VHHEVFCKASNAIVLKQEAHIFKMEVGDTIIVRIHRKAQVLVELFAQFKVFRWNKGFDFGDTQVGQINPI
jgi:hypothetical protein